MNHWAIIISPYGTRLLLNTSGLHEKAHVLIGVVKLRCGAENNPPNPIRVKLKAVRDRFSNIFGLEAHDYWISAT